MFNRDNLEKEQNRQKKEIDSEIKGIVKDYLMGFLYTFPCCIVVFSLFDILKLNHTEFNFTLIFVLIAALIGLIAYLNGFKSWFISVCGILVVVAIAFYIDLFNRIIGVYDNGCIGCLNSIFETTVMLLSTALIPFIYHLYAELRGLLRRRKTLRITPKNINKLENCIKNKKDYIVYLSDFNRGDVSVTLLTLPIEGTTGEYTVSGNQVFAEITKKLNRKLPVFYLGNAREKGHSYAGYPIIVSNSDWYNYFTAIYDHAKYAILEYPGSSLSQNIQLEIDYILHSPVKSIFYAGREEEMSALISQFPLLEARIKGIFKVDEKSSPFEKQYKPTYIALSDTAWGENTELFKK